MNSPPIPTIQGLPRAPTPQEQLENPCPRIGVGDRSFVGPVCLWAALDHLLDVSQLIARQNGRSKRKRVDRSGGGNRDSFSSWVADNRAPPTTVTNFSIPISHAKGRDGSSWLGRNAATMGASKLSRWRSKAKIPRLSHRTPRCPRSPARFSLRKGIEFCRRFKLAVGRQRFAGE
jgi:hypothetical protein